jgi:hypothetical protein
LGRGERFRRKHRVLLGPHGPPVSQTEPVRKGTDSRRSQSFPGPLRPWTIIHRPPASLQGKAPDPSHRPVRDAPTPVRHHIRSLPRPLSPSPPAPSRSRYPSFRSFLSSCSYIRERAHRSARGIMLIVGFAALRGGDRGPIRVYFPRAIQGWGSTPRALRSV